MLLLLRLLGVEIEYWLLLLGEQSGVRLLVGEGEHLLADSWSSGSLLAGSDNWDRLLRSYQAIVGLVLGWVLQVLSWNLGWNLRADGLRLSTFQIVPFDIFEFGLARGRVGCLLA